jgi:signal transduction histidine kinase
MNAYWLKERLEKARIQGVDRAAAMCSLIDSTSENMHNLAIRLRPGVLDDLGLVDALEWYTDDYERRTQIPCNFTCDEVPIIDETLATAAYRITQEALTNVARHANATQAEVDLKLDGQTMVLTIHDDGCGFNECETSESEELGLVGMRERAALVGGTLAVGSIPGKGTRVRFKVRLRHRPLASGF